MQDTASSAPAENADRIPKKVPVPKSKCIDLTMDEEDYAAIAAARLKDMQDECQRQLQSLPQRETRHIGPKAIRLLRHAIDTKDDAEKLTTLIKEQIAKAAAIDEEAEFMECILPRQPSDWLLHLAADIEAQRDPLLLYLSNAHYQALLPTAPVYDGKERPRQQLSISEFVKNLPTVTQQATGDDDEQADAGDEQLAPINFDSSGHDRKRTALASSSTDDDSEREDAIGLWPATSGTRSKAIKAWEALRGLAEGLTDDDSFPRLLDDADMRDYVVTYPGQMIQLLRAHPIPLYVLQCLEQATFTEWARILVAEQVQIQVSRLAADPTTRTQEIEWWANTFRGELTDRQREERASEPNFWHHAARLPGDDEVLAAIKRLGRGKAVGADGINNDFFLDWADHLAPHLGDQYRRIQQGEALPDSATIAIVVPIPKGGDSADPMNYRPISLLTTYYKLH
ncbi:hypothetical protein ATCC90586_001678 [Pythium insidiosum]|nr:hypothetical protein ATCC90586_001678 [Pythium insidiosum]